MNYEEIFSSETQTSTLKGYHFRDSFTINKLKNAWVMK